MPTKSSPDFVYFDGERCKVVAWTDTQTCIEFMGVTIWRPHSAVSLTKESKK